MQGTAEGGEQGTVGHISQDESDPGPQNKILET